VYKSPLFLPDTCSSRACAILSEVSDLDITCVIDVPHVERGCGCSVPGGVQDQVGWGPQQSGLVPDLEVGGLPVAGGLELDHPRGPVQPKPFYDSTFLHFLAHKPSLVSC